MEHYQECGEWLSDESEVELLISDDKSAINERNMHDTDTEDQEEGKNLP